MKFIETPIEGLWIIEPRVFEDERGFFMETYHQERFKAHGIADVFVQQNHSRSKRGVLRGLVAPGHRIAHIQAGGILPGHPIENPTVGVERQHARHAALAPIHGAQYRHVPIRNLMQSRRRGRDHLGARA